MIFVHDRVKLRLCAGRDAGEPSYRISSSVRIWWVLKETKGSKGKSWTPNLPASAAVRPRIAVQGYLAHKKLHPPGTLQ